MTWLTQIDFNYKPYKDKQYFFSVVFEEKNGDKKQDSDKAIIKIIGLYP